MKLTIASVDDICDDRDRLENNIRTFCKETNIPDVTVTSYSNANAMLADFERGAFQIAFLDICMESMNGIELARQLREKDSALLIVFLTTSREYAFDAFPIHPFDYLIKPYTYETLCGVMKEAIRTLAEPEPEITVKVPHGEYQIPLAAISSVTSDKHAVYFYTVQHQCIRSIMTFAQVTEILTKEPRFLLCNRGILVNMDHTLSLEEHVIRMNDGKVYPLRTRGRTELCKKFSQYQFSRIKRRDCS